MGIRGHHFDQFLDRQGLCKSILIVRPPDDIASCTLPDHSANYARQKRGYEYLVKAIEGFYVPSTKEKDQVLKLLGVSPRFKQAFDALRLHVRSFADIRSAQDFDLLEIKTTDACLPALPAGFFFGMTENEEMLLKVLEGKYFLCLVCLNKKSPGHHLAGWKELKGLIQNKRVQYQINLTGAKAKSAY